MLFKSIVGFAAAAIVLVSCGSKQEVTSDAGNSADSDASSVGKKKAPVSSSKKWHYDTTYGPCIPGAHSNLLQNISVGPFNSEQECKKSNHFFTCKTLNSPAIYRASRCYSKEPSNMVVHPSQDPQLQYGQTGQTDVTKFPVTAYP